MTEKDIKELFGYNIKRLRKARSLSQMELANRLDMHFTFISDIENGKKWVSPETVAKIASLLNVEPYQFLLPKEYAPVFDPTIATFARELSAAFEAIKARYGLDEQQSTVNHKPPVSTPSAIFSNGASPLFLAD